MQADKASDQGANGGEIIVGIAEVMIAKGPVSFSFVGLGSCVGLCALDPVADVSGAVHVMLPKSRSAIPVEQFGKFADTGVAEMVRLMEEAGAERSRIRAAYAGGASVRECSQGQPGFDLGSRNLDSVQEALDSLKLSIAASDAGGTTGRTLRMSATSGEVTVKTIRMGEAVLCSLRL